MTVEQMFTILIVGLLIFAVVVFLRALWALCADYWYYRRINREIKEVRKKNKDVDIYI